MKRSLLILALLLLASAAFAQADVHGWVKHEGNPVFGGPEIGTMFDANVITQGKAKFNMYVSWRPEKAIALTHSDDGINWSDPVVVLRNDYSTGWEDDINRSCTLFWNGQYHMWYVGQARGYSKIGYAISDDGINFRRVTKMPVLIPELPHEGFSVMNPYVLRDEERGVFRMWYASGETYEPNVLCYAESADGIHWEKSPLNPIYVHGEDWEQNRVGGCEVHPMGDGTYAMFYIGYRDIHTAHIGVAFSKDGITGWQRYEHNPIVVPDASSWDAHACYKPTVYRDVENNRWHLWYNGRRDGSEYIGYVTHEGLDLKDPGYQKVSDYVAEFNSADEELYTQVFDNSEAEQFLQENIPFFDCPDKELEKTYYFRWWTYRKHVKDTPEGYVITEFLPDVPWAGKYNAICCPGMHQFAEGRWLRNTDYLSDYAAYWCREKDDARRYSFPIAYSFLEFYKVHPDMDFIREAYPDLKEIYAAWEESHWDKDAGLFWQLDGCDGMEVSVSGALSEDNTGYRATINSYMYADAVALSHMARMLGLDNEAKIYQKKADKLKKIINTKLWDETARFYKVIPRHGDLSFSLAREQHGYVPWMFGIPEKSRSDAWLQLNDPQGFKAPYGPTTAEQRAEGFKVVYEGHECQWNGPSWPFATAQTLTALARTLHRDGENAGATKELFFETLQTFSKSHRRVNEAGQTVCWIDENINPFTGDWISRTMLLSMDNKYHERGKDYNHSSFCDLVISGLVGIQPQTDGGIVIEPLIPEGKWDWFTLSRISCAGKELTIVYDRDGKHYGRKAGLTVYVDGKEAAHSETYTTRIIL